MTQKISSTTLSNFKDSSMLQRNDLLKESREINYIFPSEQNNSNSSMIPNTSGLDSDSKTEPFLERGNMFEEKAKNFENKITVSKSSFNSDEQKSEDNDSSSSGRLSQRSISKKWRSISLMFKSIRGFQENEAMRLDSVDSLDQIMEKFEPPKNNKNKRKEKKHKTQFENALDHILDIEKLIDCSERGGKQDLEIIKLIVEKDPRRYLVSPTDPEHLINQKNRHGYTALYSACKNGHLNVVRYLIENEANPSLRIKLKDGIDESPLEVAARWGHVELVGFLLENVIYHEKELKNSFSLAMTTEIKQMISQKIRVIQEKGESRNKSDRFFDFLSSFCC